MTRLARAQAAFAVTGWSAPPSRHLHRQQLHDLCGRLAGAEDPCTPRDPAAQSSAVATLHHSCCCHSGSRGRTHTPGTRLFKAMQRRRWLH